MVGRYGPPVPNGLLRVVVGIDLASGGSGASIGALVHRR